MSPRIGLRITHDRLDIFLVDFLSAKVRVILHLAAWEIGGFHLEIRTLRGDFETRAVKVISRRDSPVHPQEAPI